MKTNRLTMKLLKNDARLISRDRTLVSMVVFAFLMAIGLRYLLPWLDTYFQERGVLPNSAVPNRFADYFPMLVTYFALFNGGQISGAIFGFLFLDEKDQRTLAVVKVSPVSLQNYLLCRILVPTSLGFVICSLMFFIIDQVHLPIYQTLLITSAASLVAPIMALFLANFAENKVQGFAMAKFAGIAGWTILIGWFIREPWQYIFGLFPPFLVSKSCWMASQGSGYWALVLLISIVLQLVLIFYLTRRFQSSNSIAN